MNYKLLKKCLDDNIPIIRDNTVNLIIEIIKDYKCTSLLEVGTAYGYSSAIWAKNTNLNLITSLEKNISNYEIAKQFVNNPKIEFINIDAFEFDTNKKYDIVFLDGPKSKQDILVNKYLNYLTDNGIMIIDNLFMNKFKNKDKNTLTKNQLKILKNVNEFRNWLENNNWDHKFILHNIDDGVGIIYKNGK